MEVESDDESVDYNSEEYWKNHPMTLAPHLRAKADPSHSTLIALKHLKLHLKDSKIKISRTELEIYDIIDAKGVVHVEELHQKDGGFLLTKDGEVQKEVELQLDFEMLVKVIFEESLYKARIYFHAKEHMDEYEPNIDKIIWLDKFDPRGHAMTQCNGAINSSRTKRMIRQLMDDFKRDFLQLETVISDTEDEDAITSFKNKKSKGRKNKSNKDDDYSDDDYSDDYSDDNDSEIPSTGRSGYTSFSSSSSASDTTSSSMCTTESFSSSVTSSSGSSGYSSHSNHSRTRDKNNGKGRGGGRKT